MSDESFLAEIAANPSDPAPYLIYADALQLRGDPRGELISAQHGLETANFPAACELRRRESELLDKNRDAWLGPVLAHRGELAVRWRNGFIHAARVLSRDDADAERAALRALLATPAVTSTLAELRVGSPDSAEADDTWSNCQHVIDELHAAWPASLRRLHVCDFDLRGMFLAPRVTIPEHAKTLDTLIVQSPAIELAWNATPAMLRHLEIRSPRFDARGFSAIREWPNLESLTVWIEDPARVLLVLSRANAPRLKHLGLCGTAQTPAVVAEIAKHSIVKQLASLDLSGGVLTMSKALQRLANDIELDVRQNLMGKDEREKLAAFGARVHPQRRGTSPLTDRDTLWLEHERVTTKIYDTDGKMKTYRKLVAASPDPCWLYEGRHTAASSFETRSTRDLLAELATEVRDTLVQVGSTDRADLYVEIAGVCEDAADFHQAECWLWQAVNEARWYETDEIAALGHIGTIRMRRGDPTNAVPIMDRVLAHYLEHGSKSQQAWALRQRGNVDLVRSEYATAEGFYRRALEMYRAAKDKNNEGIVLSELAGVLWSRQDFEGAVAILRESIAMRDADSLGLGSCHYNLGAVLNGMGRLDEAIEAGRQALAIFRKHQRPDGIGQSLSLLGELEQRSNRHDAAEKLLEEALEHHRERGALRETGITLGNLSRVALDRAHYGKARAFCEEAVELHREVGNKYNEGMQLLGMIDAAIGEGRLDDALAHTDEALEPLVAINNLPGMASVKLRRGYVAQLRGDYDAAEQHYDEACADTTRGNYPELVGWSQLYRAVIRALQKRRADADALVVQAETILAKSVLGMLTAAMAKAVIARIAGENVKLPEPSSWDQRVIASFVR